MNFPEKSALNRHEHFHPGNFPVAFPGALACPWG